MNWYPKMPKRDAERIESDSLAIEKVSHLQKAYESLVNKDTQELNKKQEISDELV